MSVTVLLDRLRRRWLLVLVVALVAVAAAAVAPLTRGETWTGTAALTVSSKTRSPEQDAVIARGYVDYFNQPSTQSGLLSRAGVGEGVTASATLAADSPIVYVRAVAGDPGVATDAATQLGAALRDQVRDNLNRTQGGTVNDLKAQLAAANARLVAVPADSPDRDALSQQAIALQNDINDLVTNTANQLQDLQPAAGVAPNSTGWARLLGGALVGGLMLGALAALALGRLEGRFGSASEVGTRLRLPVLGTVGTSGRGRRSRRGTGGPDAHDLLLRGIAPVANRDGVAGRGVLAVAAPSDTTAGVLARGLLSLRGRQGLPALLVQADLAADPDPVFAGRPGVGDLLTSRPGARLESVLLSDGGGLLAVPAGTGTADGWLLLGRERVGELLEQARRLSWTVVVEAPPVTRDGAGRTVCACSDRTLLVVELERTRVRDAVAAVAALAEVGVTPVGVVVVSGTDPDLQPLGDRRWRPASAPRGETPSVELPARPVDPGRPADVDRARATDPERTGPVATPGGREHLHPAAEPSRSAGQEHGSNGAGVRPGPAVPHP